MGDEVRITVIAAGFERWDDGGHPPAGQASQGQPASGRPGAPSGGGGPEREGTRGRPKPPEEVPIADVFGDDDFLDGDDDFDVPSFLR